MINPASVLLAGSSVQTLFNGPAAVYSSDFSSNADLVSSYYRIHSSFAEGVSGLYEFSSQDLDDIVEVDAQMAQILGSLSQAASFFAPQLVAPYINWIYTGSIEMYEHLSYNALNTIDCGDLQSISSVNSQVYEEFTNLMHASWISSDLTLTRPWPYVNGQRCQTAN